MNIAFDIMRQHTHIWRTWQEQVMLEGSEQDGVAHVQPQNSKFRGKTPEQKNAQNLNLQEKIKSKILSWITALLITTSNINVVIISILCLRTYMMSRSCSKGPSKMAVYGPSEAWFFCSSWTQARSSIRMHVCIYVCIHMVPLFLVDAGQVINIFFSTTLTWSSERYECRSLWTFFCSIYVMIFINIYIYIYIYIYNMLVWVCMHITTLS